MAALERVTAKVELSELNYLINLEDPLGFLFCLPLSLTALGVLILDHHGLRLLAIPCHLEEPSKHILM